MLVLNCFPLSELCLRVNYGGHGSNLKFITKIMWIYFVLCEELCSEVVLKRLLSSNMQIQCGRLDKNY